MKLKPSLNLWNELKHSRKSSDDSIPFFSYQPSALDRCIQLDESDFDKAIKLAKTWKKPELAKSYQLDKKRYILEMQLSAQNQPYSFIPTLKSALSYRKQVSSIKVISAEVSEVYSDEIKFLQRFEELGTLFRNYDKTVQNYEEAKEKYELSVAQMNKFDEIVKQGISPDEFSWTMIENESKN